MTREKIYSYYLKHCPAQRENIFIEEEDNIEKLKGKPETFVGEVYILDLYDLIKVISEDPEEVDVVKRIFGKTICGFHPIK